VNDSALRLLFVVKSLATEAGGAERVLCEICSELAERGHSTTIASFDHPNSADFYLIDRSVERIRLGLGKTDRRTGLLELMLRILGLRSLQCKLRPDVTIGFMHSAYIPLSIATLGSETRIIASEHIAYEHYRQRRVERFLLNAIAPRCAAFTVPLEDVRRGFPDAIRNRMTVIPNPVALRASSHQSARGARRRLLFVGNFRAQKDHRTLIDAFARLAARHSDWDLRLVGEGPLRADIERHVGALGLQSRVTFTGAVTGVSEEYATADVFVIPSAYESFGLATAEALANGIPAVGFADCPGTNQIIQDGKNGILVDGSDRVQALAAGLDRLMNSAELRESLGQQGPASVEHYSLAAVVDRWEELLRSVSQQHS